MFLLVTVIRKLFAAMAATEAEKEGYDDVNATIPFHEC